ncbi:MAG: hypothetical protein WC179_06780 [Candidatus Cloacimonadaceae bacterium]|jgi:hypothetical protein
MASKNKSNNNQSTVAVPETIEEFKSKVRERQSKRIERAVPYTLPDSGISVLIAPAVGEEFYNKLLSININSISSGVINCDLEFLKLLVKVCVVKPPLDDEAINLLIDTNVSEFQELANMCFTISTANPEQSAQEIFGEVNTEVQEAFLKDIGGSGNT